MDQPPRESPGQNLTLNALVRRLAHEKIRQFSGDATIEIEELEGEQMPILGHWMAIILVSGESLHLTLKTHFATSEVARIMPASPDLVNVGRLTMMARDFVKEFCNLVAGSIKLALHNQGIATGISLPLVTRGFDELFESHGTGQVVESDRWKFSLEGASIVITTEVLASKDLKITEPGESAGDSLGDVEFF